MKKLILIIGIILLGLVGFSQGGTKNINTAGSNLVKKDASENATITGNFAAASYETVISPLEISYLNGLGELIQTSLDARCLESVFGTSIGDGLTLDGAVLKASLGLQSITGLTETNGGILYGTADNAYAWLAAGTAGKVLQANGAAAPSFVTALADGITATTQSAGDNSTKVATTAYVEEATQNGTDYGEMGNVYGSSATEALGTADEWYAMYHANITGSTPHLNSGFTFVAGSSGSGTTTTAGTGDSINIADAAHGLLEGDIVTVQSANHTTIAYVTYIDAGNFQIKVAYAADEAITWQMGSYLLCATTGTYRGAWNACFMQSLNTKQTTRLPPYLNITEATKATSQRMIETTTDSGPLGGNGLMAFTAGDRIWFAAQTTAAQTLTFLVRNISVH